MLNKVLINNFAIDPYEVKNPLGMRLMICKYQKRSSIFKSFDLIIEGQLFSELYQQQPKPAQPEHPMIKMSKETYQ